MMTRVAGMDYPIVDYPIDTTGKGVVRSHFTDN